MNGPEDDEFRQGLLLELSKYSNEVGNRELIRSISRTDYIRVFYLSLWSSTLPLCAGILVVLFSMLELVISGRIRYLGKSEISRKIHLIRELIKKSRVSDTLTPEEFAHWSLNSTALVFKEQCWRRVPINLLIQNDIVDPDSNCLIKDYCVLGEDGKHRLSMSMLGLQLKELLNFKSSMPPTISRRTSWEEWIQLLSLFYSILCLLKLLPARVLPVVVMSSTLWNSIWLLYGNCRISLLTRILNGSKSPYEMEDIDEFDDSAPPPTLNISLSPFSVAKEMLNAFKGSVVTLMYDLPSCIANATFIAFVDKQGLLSHEYPLPSEIVSPSRDIAESALQIEEIHINYIHSRIYLSLPNQSEKIRALKMLGFSILATSNCKMDRKLPFREAHCSSFRSGEDSINLPQFRMCTCFVAKEAGFDLKYLEGYVKLKELQVKELSVSCKIMKLKEDRSIHLFSLGPLKSILSLCQYCWNSQSIESISSDVRTKFEDFERRLSELDAYCRAFSYAPLVDCLEQDLELNTNTRLQKCIKRQIFLGTITFAYEPRSDLQEVIDDLENCGVRFVFFSAHPEIPTKLFGSRLGLDTTWNSCIILSQDSDLNCNDPYSNAYSDPKSKLPRGINNIRPHLQDVDDIPLHLSLFAEATPELAAEMISIYRENDEIPIVIGSSLCPQNTLIFSKSICSISMCPITTENVDAGSPDTLTSISSQLTSILTPITLSYESSPYVITELLRESRHLNLASFVSTSLRLYGLVCMAMISFIVPLDYVMLSSVFLVSLLTNLSAYEADIPSFMSKRPFLTDLWLHYNIFCLSICLIAFLLAILGKLFFAAANLNLCVTTLLISITCLFIHPYKSFYQLGLRYNVAWWMTVIMMTLAAVYQTERFQLHYQIIVAFAFAIIMTTFGDFIKRTWRGRVLLHERRSRLLFNTKLGMHSPV